MAKEYTAEMLSNEETSKLPSEHVHLATHVCVSFDVCDGPKLA